jgi:hypothetical protein
MINSLKTALLFFALITVDVSAQPQRLTEAIGQLHQQLQQPDRQGAHLATQLIDQWIDIPSFTQDAFSSYVEQSLTSYEEVLSEEAFTQLVSAEKERLARAVRDRLVRDLSYHLNRPSLYGVELRDLRAEASGPEGTAHLALIEHGGERTVELELIARAGDWRIVRIALDKIDLGQYYHSLCSDLITQRYSLPVVISRLGEVPYVVLDDFSSTPIGQTPADWGSWRDKDRGKPLLYRVQTSGEQTYMAAQDSGYSVILGKFVHWNPREYPIMTWCWRANALPPGGNEFLNHANDSAAGIYVIFSQNWLHVPKQLKYVWSSTLPEGTIGRRDKLFRPWFFVLESGEENRGKWTFEMVDLVRDHRHKLGGVPAERTIGLGLLTDANSTHSYAEADYADLRVWKREALERRQIVDHCATLRSSSSHGY